MKANPDKTEEELFHIYEGELNELDFGNERCRVFAVEVEGHFAGHGSVQLTINVYQHSILLLATDNLRLSMLESAGVVVPRHYMEKRLV